VTPWAPKHFASSTPKEVCIRLIATMVISLQLRRGLSRMGGAIHTISKAAVRRIIRIRGLMTVVGSGVRIMGLGIHRTMSL
jgi:hypothetical protein